MLKEVSSGERIKRALFKFFIFIGLALLSVFIPVAHFVLVPTFLLLSFVIAYLQYKKRYHFSSSEVPCMHCKNQFSVEGLFPSLRERVDCTHCGAQNSIKLDELASN